MKFFYLAPVALLLAACSELGMAPSGDNTPKPAQQYAATVRITPYIDARNNGNPRKIGTGGENIFGFDAPKGTDILLDEEVASLVGKTMKKQLIGAGFQVAEQEAMFELGGTIKELTLNVKGRDEVKIAIQSQLKDVKTGKILWEGLVEEKNDRFAGVGGDDMSDVVNYLNRELGVVGRKTAEASGAVLMAQHPELFSILPGTKVIPGVTVLNAPGASSAVPVTIPVAGGKGVLVIGSEPQQAKVTIDDVYYGATPLHLDMDPGIHTVSAALDGYRKAVQKVSVRRGETTDLELKLKKR